MNRVSFGKPQRRFHRIRNRARDFHLSGPPNRRNGSVRPRPLKTKWMCASRRRFLPLPVCRASNTSESIPFLADVNVLLANYQRSCQIRDDSLEFVFAANRPRHANTLTPPDDSPGPHQPHQNPPFLSFYEGSQSNCVFLHKLIKCTTQLHLVASPICNRISSQRTEQG